MLRQGRDLFTVVPKGPERCKKYDVVLYRRPSDPYVLHRIIEVRPDSYVILGDNCIAKEYGIRDEDILGVLTSFQHNGHTVSVSDWRYRLYPKFGMREMADNDILFDATRRQQVRDIFVNRGYSILFTGRP